MSDLISLPAKKSPFGTRTNEERQASLVLAQAARKAAQEAKRAATVKLGRYTLAPDTDRTATGTGAGWKLSAPFEPDRFFRLPEQAKAWLATHSKDSAP
jgi:hypothetical protein